MKDKSKLTRIYEIVIISTFLLFIMGFCLYSLTDVNPTVSEKEQRMLKPFPTFSISSYLDGSFMQDTQDAYTDTFPFRDFFVTANSNVRQLLTVKMNGEVFVGTNGNDGTEADNESSPWDDDNTVVENPDEGYDWDQSGSKTPLPTATPDNQHATPSSTPEITPTLQPTKAPTPKPTAIVPAPTAGPDGSGTISGGVLIQDNRGMEVFNGSQTNADKYIDFINTLSSTFPDQKIISLTIPTSMYIYGPDKYTKGVQDQKAWIAYMSQRFDSAISPNIYETMVAHKNEYIYFRTDHHWTVDGAYYAYEQITNELGLQKVLRESLEAGKLNKFWGTLYSNTNSSVLKEDPDYVRYYIPSVVTKCIAHYDRKDLSKTKEIELVTATTSSNKYKAFIAGDNPLTIITTNAGTGRNAVVIKNSYANALVPFLAHNYDNIYVIDPRHVNTTLENGLNLEKYINNKDIDDIFVCLHMNHVMSGTIQKCLARLV